MIGGKISEITADELYKWIKENTVDYDDIKGIYSKALEVITESKFEELKSEAICEFKIDQQNEIQTNKYNRRSYRLSKKAQKDQKEEYDLTKVGFLVLFKILRNFREENKDKLESLSSHNSKNESNKLISKSSNQNEDSLINKRKSKEERKLKEDGKANEI